MVQKREWSATCNGMSVRFECPWYNELLPANSEYGRLTRDFECHALWNYYGLAMLAHERAKANLVADDELSLKFDQRIARNLFESIAKAHNVSPAKMVRYWDIVQRQRIALGGGDDLPDEFKFRFWGS